LCGLTDANYYFPRGILIAPHWLKHNLNKLKRKPGSSILYLSFHGHPGEILVDGHSVKINSLASLMGNGFTDWVVHFGCCETIDIEKDRIA